MEKLFLSIIGFFIKIFLLSIIFGIIIGLILILIISSNINMEKIKKVLHLTTTEISYESSSVIDNRLYKNRGSESSIENHFVSDVSTKKHYTPTFIHKIQSGETLFSIGRKYNVDIRVLVKINKLNSSKINAGDKLIIPVIIRS